jgi:carbonic anhydrase
MMAQGHSRRAFLGRGVRLGGAALAAGSLVAGESLARPDAAPALGNDPQPKTPDEALKRMLAGNRRFAGEKLKNQGRDSVRRIEVAEGQKPFAIVLGCADSRVPPEVVFDQGLGDIFTVRVAGNTASDPVVAGSIEYSAANLGSMLLMVLGHDECGAVHAAIDVTVHGKTVPGDIGAVVEPVIPAVEAVRNAPEAELLDQATRANIRRSVDALQTAYPLLTDMVSSGKLKVVGAEYQLKSGKVDMVVP